VALRFQPPELKGINIMAIKKVALLTAGGLAPCLSTAIGRLIERYTEVSPETEIIAYIGGYKGLLQGNFITVTDEIRENASILYKHGGSPIGNSRVKLTNVKDCEKRGLVQPGENPLEVAANQLITDGVEVLHTIGGDDTNTTAADLAAYLAENDYKLIVVGLPKTIDNDVFPIQQSLGAWTAAEQGAKYFENVVAEHNANPRMLIIHEVMGRSCGWLTAYTAKVYHENLEELDFLPNLGLSKERKDVHAIFIPEMAIDIAAEAERLGKLMDEYDNVNIFISEGAGLDAIIKEMEAAGEDVPRDAFGHAKLDAVNPGVWFGKQFAKLLGAEKVLIQKSGYFARAAASNEADLKLIKACCDKAIESAQAGIGGVVGHDDDQNFELRAIEFPRIAGGKPFNIDEPWFDELLADLGQTKGTKVVAEH
jgi:pyrophosphate--fructose-6-phosphate 1-phosphotransferase